MGDVDDADARFHRGEVAPPYQSRGVDPCIGSIRKQKKVI